MNLWCFIHNVWYSIESEISVFLGALLQCMVSGAFRNTRTLSKCHTLTRKMKMGHYRILWFSIHRKIILQAPSQSPYLNLLHQRPFSIQLTSYADNMKDINYLQLLILQLSTTLQKPSLKRSIRLSIIYTRLSLMGHIYI